VPSKISAEESLKTIYRIETLNDIHTKLLNRVVEVELLLPPGLTGETKVPLLLLNDGQDNEAVKIKTAVEKLVQEESIPPIIIAGVKAGDRMQEYGLAAKKDFMGRGGKAKAYSSFITQELIPYLIYKYPIDVDPSRHAIAGYSLGGLSALDIAWNHPDIFLKVGIFSGSFWWRKRSTSSRFYSDHRDRLMHQQIKNGKHRKNLQFWFQAGTNDEASDRNENGVIDSIDDTLDLIVELTKKGYRPFNDIQYLEIKDGEHNHNTWSKVMPQFLRWAFSS
jgi:enterochelin esterase-like enzyme